jgi:GxxExxY protein
MVNATNRKDIDNNRLICGDLTYKIIGILYGVYNTIGPGFQEKYYQRAIKKMLEKEKLSFLEQVRVEFEWNGTNLGRYYIDFVVENKVVLEIKAKSFFSHKDVRQVLAYLKKTKIEVGLLATFSGEGIKVKRILKGRS